MKWWCERFFVFHQKVAIVRTVGIGAGRWPSGRGIFCGGMQIEFSACTLEARWIPGVHCLKEMRWGSLGEDTQSPRLASSGLCMGVCACTFSYMCPSHTHTEEMLIAGSETAKSSCISFIYLLDESMHRCYWHMVGILSHSPESPLSAFPVSDFAFLCPQLWETSI